VQRVTEASVTVEGIVKSRIEGGLLVYLGVAHNDSETDADWLSEKIAYLRIFNDKDGKMNLSLRDLAAGNKHETDILPAVLVVSQFTLLGDARKGRRPSWNGAASPDKARLLYEYFIKLIRKHDLVCESGEFQAHMKVSYTNDGPVTIILDTKDI